MGDDALGEEARALIADEDNRIFVSAASAMEISTKHRLGKLPDAGLLATNLPQFLSDQDFIEMPISIAHAATAGNLRIAHKDPFDRFLIAQSLVENCPLVSNEALFDAFGVNRIW
ncbi:type II toxin-antitoxin system VapC family toxin [Sphingomonas nostoxanthinifaciens]|uniref:type II toxin-antitoxin system VapC family toxin n=1 Tax=Sphingomonas nostoxanthinifaciens TaxID=2872652 RepID=UPI0021D864C0|nr:type II toxin-antitoxin system VapC family toxin [Sphingomonas nostoxanthinifaciens]